MKLSDHRSMMTFALVALAPLVALVAPACGNRPDAATLAPSSASPSSPPASGSIASAAPATAASDAPEPARRRKPFEISNSCTEVATVVFGEDPKKPGANSRTVAPSAVVEGPREADGNQTVWLLDAKGEPLIKVNVTRGMKRVEIGRSCRTLDAR